MKKVWIGVAALAVVVVAVLFYVWTNLDSIVKAAIETYGSEATQTAVRVDSVGIKLMDGTARIDGLTVANPAGFTDPNIFELGMISTAVDTSTINEDPIVIDEIVISAPSVVYEINTSGVSNVDVLKKSLGAGGGAESASADGADKGGGVRMIIRRLVVEGSSAKVRIAALDRERSVKLPRIVMTGIGEKSGGATALEVATQVSERMLGNVQSSVASIGVEQYLGKSAEEVRSRMEGKMKEQMGEATGGAAEKAGEAIKGLFGN